MRISDWSSDVCSSDLAPCTARAAGDAAIGARRSPARPQRTQQNPGALETRLVAGAQATDVVAMVVEDQQRGDRHEIGRASCRERVCSTCRSRLSPYHYKKTLSQYGYIRYIKLK